MKKTEVSFEQILDWVRNPDSYKTVCKIILRSGLSAQKTQELLDIVDRTARSKGITLAE